MGMKYMESVNDTLKQEVVSLKKQEDFATNKDDDVDELNNLLRCLKLDGEADGLTDAVTEANDEKTSTIEADDHAIAEAGYRNKDIDDLCNILQRLKLDDETSSTIEEDDPAILQAGEYLYTVHY